MDQKDLRILLVHQKLAVIYPYVSLLYKSKKHEKMDTGTFFGKKTRKDLKLHAGAISLYISKYLQLVFYACL